MREKNWRNARDNKEEQEGGGKKNGKREAVSLKILLQMKRAA